MWYLFEVIKDEFITINIHKINNLQLKQKTT